MKQIIKTIIRAVAAPALNPLRQEIDEELLALRKGLLAKMDQGEQSMLSIGGRIAQVGLLQRYRDRVRMGEPGLSFSEVGFRCHSQFDEDGILLYIFGIIGTTNCVAVEICAGDGIQCNTANLIINHGWHGFLFDGNEDLVKKGRTFYDQHPDTFLQPPVFTKAWITAENVNQLLMEAGVTGEVDLLSLDMDGMDYWVWEKIESIKPRVMVCETLNVVPPELSLTVPYDSKFQMTQPDFHGVSLAAMAKLARAKGYRLVGTHRYGFNAFFVRNDVGENLLPEVTVESCVQDSYSRQAREIRWPKVKDLGWVEV